MAKGIRVSQLAKDLGVTSKVVMEKCRAEGLGDKVKNPQSSISLGLAETVREWFSTGSNATAVETADAVDTAVKTKTTKRATVTKSAASDAGSPDDSSAGGVATAEAPRPRAPEAAPRPPMIDDSDDESSDAAPTNGEATPAVAATNGSVAANGDGTNSTTPTPVADAPGSIVPGATGDPADVNADASPTPPAVAVVPSAPAKAAPATPTPAAPSGETPPEPKPEVIPGRAGGPTLRPAARAHPRDERSDLPPAPESRPTISLQSGGTVVQRPAPGAVTPAPQLTTLTRPVMQGPKLIREEKPDVVPAPRPRRTFGPNGGPSVGPGGTVRAQAKTGGGVRVSAATEAEEEEKKKQLGRTLSARRRGPDGRRGEAMEKLREFTEADIIARKDALNAATASRARFDHHLRKTEAKGTGFRRGAVTDAGGAIEIEEPITVKTLSGAIGVKANDLIRKLMRTGVFATVNQSLDTEVAQTLALEFGIELAVAEQRSMEDLLVDEFADREVKTENLVGRPPVVTILGHVDHGKTSLLDKIRSANVAAGESGGITQHIAAFNVKLPEDKGGKTVTFIDTPGHQAFTDMRARGANMTDVVVLVVSAAEGVQPQTIESINHAKAAGVPIVVALNKIDRPDANADRVLGQLAANDLQPVEYGGQTEVVRTSATTGKGVDDLLEVLGLQADIMDLKADPTAPATGVVIESRVDAGLGPVCTVLVQNGTLGVQDVLVSGAGYGRIRALMGSDGKQVREAGPSTPVLVSGLSELPGAAERFYEVDDFDRARSIAEERSDLDRRMELANYNKVSLDNLFATMDEGDIKTINLILKGDVQGSVDTLAKTVTDQNTEEVRVKVIHSAVGAINESDVALADASEAVIIGFHVAIDEKARDTAERRGVEVRTYNVIYEIFDDLKNALGGMLEPEMREKYHGAATVQEVFKVSRLGNIAGCLVVDGHVQRGSKVRLVRDGDLVVADLSIESLRRAKDDAREVKQGLECGIKLANYNDIKVDDRLEFYVTEKHQRTL